MADNINISPDMIDNLVNMLKNSNVSNNSDLKDVLKDASNNGNLNDVLKNVSNYTNKNSENTSENASENSNYSNNNSGNNSSSFQNLDFETIMKIKSIMDALNNNDDPNSNLLYSLKPYLRKSRQSKLDQYINILKISQVSKFLKNDKGDL